MVRVDPAVLANDPDRRGLLVRALEAGLGAIDPEAAVHRALHRDRATVRLDEGVTIAGVERVIVLALGKAAPAMVRGAAGALAGLPLLGAAVSTRPSPPIGRIEMLAGGHPVPDAGSIDGAGRLLHWARRARPGDLVLFLISGGGSALVERPAGDLTLADLVETTALLLRSGAAIGEVNTVRKHLSDVKGGRLAEEVPEGAAVVTLVVSDVVGNPLDVIASGPTVADPTTFDDALAVLDRYGLDKRVPGAVLDHLRTGAAGRIPDTPPTLPSHVVRIVADAASAARAAAQRAEREGVAARVVSTTLEGEAREVGRWLVEEAAGWNGAAMAVYGGETTVTVTGDGGGGRNQEVALAAGLALEGDPRIVVASFGTDGVDGPTDAAGGIGDGWTVERGNRLGLDAATHLADNDAYPYLAATGDLLRTGPTGTNVGDLLLVYRSR